MYGHPRLLGYDGWTSQALIAIILKYKNIKLPASLLDVNTRLQSLLSLHPFEVTYSIHLKPGAVARVPIKYQDDNHLKFQQHRVNQINRSITHLAL